MKLYLDLSTSKVAVVRLIENDKTLEEASGPTPLPLIDRILKKHHLVLEDLEEVDSFPGPGSYTGLKVSSALANILNWHLGISKVIIPNYGAKNTQPKN